MAVFLKTSNLDIPSRFTHEETQWILATDKELTNRIIDETTSVGLTSKVFNIKLEAGTTYYGAARCILDTGFSVWSVIKVHQPTEEDVVIHTPELPAVIITPSVSMSDVSSVENNSLYTVSVITGDFETVETISHSSTDYVLEDMNGNVIDSNLEDDVEKYGYTFNLTNPLERDSVYRVKVSYRGTNNDVSNVGVVTFKTTK